MAEIWILREKHEFFFFIDFPNRMNCKNRNGVMLVNIFLKIFSQFFKIWVECLFNAIVKFFSPVKLNAFAKFPDIACDVIF